MCIIRLAILMAAQFWIGQVAAAPIQLQCGDKNQLESLSLENQKFNFNNEAKLSEQKMTSDLKLLKQKISEDLIEKVISTALEKGVDPYALVAVYFQNFYPAEKDIPVSTLSMAKAMACETRAKTDIKHFSAEDIASLKSIEERQYKNNIERPKLKGGDDFEEWKSIQKDIEKFTKKNEELKAQLKTLSAEKKEETKDQIIDNEEEIKGLTKEQEDFTKTPDMKRIVAIEKERIEMKIQTDAIRSRALKASEGKATVEEINREMNCIRSDSCVALFLPSEKSKEATAEDKTPKLCLKGDLLRIASAEFLGEKDKSKGSCCQFGESKKDLVLRATAQSLSDHFANCIESSPAAECLAKHFDYKGDCAAVFGANVAYKIVESLMGNAPLNQRIEFLASSQKKSVSSIFCQVNPESKSVTLDAEVLRQEFSKIQAANKRCKISR